MKRFQRIVCRTSFSHSQRQGWVVLIEVDRRYNMLPQRPHPKKPRFVRSVCLCCFLAPMNLLNSFCIGRLSTTWEHTLKGFRNGFDDIRPASRDLACLACIPHVQPAAGKVFDFARSVSSNGGHLAKLSCLSRRCRLSKTAMPATSPARCCHFLVHEL